MDWENFPLPPNWETRFDKHTRRWFFINHLSQFTTWDDPRPAFYGSERAGAPRKHTSGRRTKDQGRERSYSSTHSTPESPYSDVDHSRTVSPRFQTEFLTENEDEQETTDSNAYNNSLRATHMDLDERQSVQVSEELLGNSPELRNFFSQQLGKRLSTGSLSERQKNRKQSGSEQARTSYSGSGGVKPLTRPTIPLRPVSESGPSFPSETATRDEHSRSQRRAESRRTSDVQRMSTNTIQPRLGTTETAESFPSKEPSEPSERETQELMPAASGLQEPTINQVPEMPQSPLENEQPETLLPFPSASKTSTSRVTPRGPDPSIRVTRIKAMGPNLELVKGPNKQLVSGSLFSQNSTNRER